MRELVSRRTLLELHLGETVDRLLTDPETGKIAEPRLPLAQALKSMKRANSGLTWIRQRHVTEFLQ